MMQQDAVVDNVNFHKFPHVVSRNVTPRACVRVCVWAQEQYLVAVTCSSLTDLKSSCTFVDLLNAQSLLLSSYSSFFSLVHSVV